MYFVRIFIAFKLKACICSSSDDSSFNTTVRVADLRYDEIPICISCIRIVRIVPFRHQNDKRNHDKPQQTAKNPLECCNT